MLPSLALLQLIAVSLLAHVALAGSRVTTSLYAISLHASEFTIGSLIALYSLFPMLLAVPAGRAIDRMGMLRPMLAGAAAVALGCALPGLVGGLAILYVASVLMGTGFMVIQVAAQHSVGVMSNDAQRASNYSWLALGFSISGFCGPVTAGFIIDHARHGVSFLGFACVALCSLALIGCGPLRRAGQADASEHARPSAGGSAMELLRDGDMRRIYFVGTLLSSAWDLFTFVTPINGTRLGFSASTIGLILGSFSAATFAVRLIMPWVSKRLSEWQILTAALSLAVLCYLMFPFMHAAHSVMLVAALLGFAVGSAQPNMLALLHHTSPPGRAAEAVGMRVTIGNACQVVLPLAFGGAGAALGLQAVFWGMGAMIGAGVPTAWRKAHRPLGKY
ncbi:MFS transporter [Noviherbaspirillum galbum]|uniref:MFS transporter n=1 Tax=Noviherbaspirillum galbum TaxID=2709383 RepID=A0A6B3SI67_9BURK|nr:MFS transporter [Noviherbaspirillum galbum]NEX60544.1 MFS transporter [Noviherbaspirillum galbum]